MYTLMVVDDEALERKALTMIVEKNCPEIQVIAETGDGVSACQLALENRPDIILMDIRMPGMNGLEAAERIQRELPDTSIIILTAFDEFDYAKEALKIGAIEYLLKPVRPPDIVATLKKAGKKIGGIKAKQVEERQLRASVEAAIPFIQMSFVYDLISGSIGELETIRSRYRFLGFTLDPAVVMIVDIDNFKQMTQAETELEKQVVKQKLHQHILNFLGHQALVTPFGSDNLIIVLGFADKKGPEEIEAEVRSKAHLLRDSIAGALGISVTIGIGNYYQDAREINKSYREAVAAQRQRFYLGDNQIIHVKDIPHLNDGPFHYPYQHERAVLDKVRCGDRAQAREALSKLLDDIFSSHASIEVVKSGILELVIVLSRSAVEGGANLEHLTLLNFQYMEQLHNCTNKQQITDWLLHLLDEFIDNMMSNRTSMNLRVIHKACDYIIKNYHKNISLEEVAQTVHLSPFYFSRLFKQEQGCNFVDFLTKVRIDQAKKMLQRSDYTAVRIASEVGYKDASYFSRVFRQAVGSTPNQYRHEVRMKQSEPTEPTQEK